MFRVQSVVNLPLASWARLRVGIDRQTRDGYLHNVSGIGPKNFGNVDYTAARGSLVLDISPTIENYSIVSYSKSDNYGSPPQIWKTNPTSFYGILIAGQVARQKASGDPYQIEQKLANPQSLSKQVQLINTTTWLATDNLTIKNIFSYSRIQQRLRQDIFASSIPLSTLKLALPAKSYAGLAFAVPADAQVLTSASFSPDSGWTNDQKNVTEELQFQGRAAEGKLNYQFGLYFEHSFAGSPTISMSPNVGSLCSPAAFTEITNVRCSVAAVTKSGKSAFNYQTGTLEFINMAAYGQATYAITDQFKLTGGLRYTYDRTQGHSTGLLYGFAGNFPGGYGSAVLTGCQDKYIFAGCVTPGSLLRTSTKKPTWTINATYAPTHDVMFYASYSRGYRQGSAAPFAIGGNATFRPEKVDAYEAGVKTSFRGAVSGNLNLAGFYSSLRDQQLQIGLLDSTTGNTATSIFNVGKSRIYGFDIDSMVRFADYFAISGSATYVNSKVTQLDPTLLNSFKGLYDVIQPSANLGDPLPYTPKWALSVGPTFTLPIDPSYGKIDLSATYRYASAYTTEASKDLITGYPSDGGGSAVKQLDLNFNWSDIGGTPIDFSVFATNVTKQVTYVLNQTLFTSFGFDQRYLGQPRIIGARLRVRFGEVSK
jgi:iron complex outermembrane receptor protein